MSTSAQISANQANAQHSTGPKSPEGKAAVAQNNFRHGLTGIFRVHEYEKQDEYDALLAGLTREHAPQTLTEEMLVEKMAQSYWLRKRALLLENFCLQKGNVAKPESQKQLALYMRYQTTHDRAFHAALNTLLKLRAEKRKAEIGFESQERKRKEDARKEVIAQHRVAAETRKQELHQWALLLAEAKLTTETRHHLDPQFDKTVAPVKEETRARAQHAA